VYTRAWPQRRHEAFFQGCRLDVKAVPPGGITISDEDIVIDANLLASHLGLSEQKLKAEMRSGLVYGVAEKGVGEDEGQTRLTFRYRARSWTVVVGSDGSVVTPSQAAMKRNQKNRVR
jgi:Family of unknown function (DUF6522)